MEVKDLIKDARAAVEAGDLDKAKKLTDQAAALKAIEALAPVETPPPGRPLFPNGDSQDAHTVEDYAVKAWYLKRFGEPDAAFKAIGQELYGMDYARMAWAKNGDFRRYLKYGKADPDLARVMLLSPAQMIDAVQLGLTMAEIKTTMIEGSDTLGGYLVPEDVRTNILQRVVGLTVVRPLANVASTVRDVVQWPKATGGTSQYTGAVRVTWVDEVPTAGDADTAWTWGQVSIPVHTVMADISISRNLIEDAAFNVQAFFERQFSEAMAIDEDTKFLTGTGAGCPQGILNGTAASGAPFDADLVTNTVNSGAAATLTADGLKAVPFALDAQYRQSASCVWIMSKATALVIYKLKDGASRYLWSAQDTQLSGGARNLPLEGYPVRESESMPSVTTNTYPIIFGDLGGYVIADRIGMSVERYLDSATARANSVIFVCRRRVGGQVAEGYRMVVQKCAA